MPITIVYPETGEPWGPGFLVRAESDFIGPLPSDSVWDLYLTAPANEDVMAHWTQPALSPILEIVFFNGSDTVTTPVPGRPTWVTGENAQLMAVLSTPSTSFEEIETVQVVLDREAGQAAELAKYIETHAVPAGQGMSELQSEQLQIIEASVTAWNPLGTLSIASGLADALRGAPIFSLGHLTTPPVSLTGDGELELDEPSLFIWGVYFTADIPAGFGRLHGQTVEYQQRLVQFRTVHIVDGQELVTEVLDANFHGYLWIFPKANWLRVEYSVTPGVVIHAQWWIWP